MEAEANVKKNGKRTIVAAVAVMLVMACALFTLSACDESSTLGTKDERSDPAYVEFGMFPQTVKADDVTVDESSADANGWYLGSDGARYAKVTAAPHGSCAFSTGAAVESGKTYYFKVEPIRWQVLSDADGTMFLLADRVLANMAYDADCADYAESDIRAWLNGDFLTAAFNAEESAAVLVTEVDNSSASTGFADNDNACENTNDKIFLPSRAEMISTAYNFLKDDGPDRFREREVSDYAKATGAYAHPEKSADGAQNYYGNGWWWLRSPIDWSDDVACAVHVNGIVRYGSADYVSLAYIGVVPALKVPSSALA